MPTTYADVVRAIESAGLVDRVIALHSSLKSFGHLEGGAETVVRAFLDTGCTLVVPTFTYGCQVSPPPGWTLAQNGDEGRHPFDMEHVTGFDSASPMIERSMGAVPAYILSLRARVRGDHPLNSFAAIGPQAAEIIAAQGMLNVYGPYKKMITRSDAYVLLIGVGLTRTTPIHFGEEQSGRRLFRRWAKQADGKVMEVEVGSCSDGFNHFDPVVNGIEKTIQVGDSQWRIFPFKPFIDTIAAVINQTPTITHCDDPDCIRCRDMVLGGPLLSARNNS
ncbi:MAG: AAC(3) family N-acetyltransferase [Chloroflexi bacterium]|nr:AAC(3) family N-acetyltransferase [Chloroflexota bacterium]